MLKLLGLLKKKSLHRKTIGNRRFRVSTKRRQKNVAVLQRVTVLQRSGITTKCTTTIFCEVQLLLSLLMTSFTDQN